MKRMKSGLVTIGKSRFKIRGLNPKSCSYRYLQIKIPRFRFNPFRLYRWLLSRF